MLAALAFTAGAAGLARAADRPVYYDRPITEADVAGRTLRELAIMRNTIFARAGQPFRKQWLHDYFSALPWYKAKGIVDPKTLPAVDQKNADFLSRYEIGLPRVELEKRLAALQDRHRHRHADFGEPLAIAFTPDGKQALLAGTHSAIRVDAASGQPLASWSVLLKSAGFVTGTMHAVAVTGAQPIATADLGPAGTAQVLTSKHPDGFYGRAAVFSADGHRLLAGPAFVPSESEDGSGGDELIERSIVAIEVATGKQLFKRETEETRPCLALSADAGRALVTEGGTVSLWDAATGKVMWRQKLYANPQGVACTSAAIAADGAAAALSWLTATQLIDLKSGKLLHTLAQPSARALAFSPRGDQLLAGGGGLNPGDKASLVIWDVKRGQRLRALPTAGDVSVVAWSPDGARALSNGARGPALWDAAAGKPIAAFPGHETWWNRDEQIEAVLLSRALGRPLAMFSQLDFERTPFDVPALLDELVTVDQLKTMSRRDLRILRNMVYARRGRAFRSPLLREYFERLDWYKLDPAYKDARLTAIDRRNIKLIQSVETELGGPINDRQQKEEEVPEA